jgi:uncharacterized repeat protein (TIGR01451 family)
MNGRKVKIIFTLCLVMPFLVATELAVRAQEQQPKVTLNLIEEKEVKVLKEGKWIEEKMPVEKVNNQDTLVYTITYVNKGKTGAKDISIVDPIPEGTVYLPESAVGKGSEITYSIDGGKRYQPQPVKYVITKPDGTQEEKIASADMYTNIKWVVKDLVLPGHSGRVSFKVKVN